MRPRADAFPHHPQFADGPLHKVLLIQRVFFAYCTQARNACRAGDWTAARVSKSIETAWPIICDSYVTREHGTRSEEAKSKLRVATWRTITDDAQWKQHLSELAALAARPEHRGNIVPKVEAAAPTDGDPTLGGLRRDRYPFRYWLHDHSHEPIEDPKAELDYWKAHVWHGYHVLIENCERMGMAWADRHEKLNSATAGLSYDLAVLQANYAIDRGLRGEEGMRAFRDEAAELLEEVTSSWRASCERLAVTFEDDTEEVKNLAQPFHRVRDDLRRLLPETSGGFVT